MLGDLLGALDTGVNLMNFGLGLKQYDYQKQLNQTLMSREDSAYQRAVADAQKAGLSKASISGGASAQQLGAGNMPSLQSDLQQRRLNALSMQDIASRIGIQDQEEESAFWNAQYAKLNFRDAFLSSPYSALFPRSGEPGLWFGVERNGKEWNMNYSTTFHDYQKQNTVNWLKKLDAEAAQFDADRALAEQIAEHPWWYMYGSDMANSVIKNLTPNLSGSLGGTFRFKP